MESKFWLLNLPSIWSRLAARWIKHKELDRTEFHEPILQLILFKNTLHLPCLLHKQVTFVLME